MKIESLNGPNDLLKLGGWLAQIFTNMHPDDAQVRMSALFVNMVGNIPAKDWEEIKAAAKRPCECGDPECGHAIAAVIQAGDLCREYFKRITERQRHENPEEKGLTE